jgi:WD40 repeat protein
LSRVSDSGGAAEALTSPAPDADEVGHFWPEELPGGRAVIFTTTGRGDTEPFKISIHSSDRPGHRDLLDTGRSARYSPSGHLLYTVASSLMAVPFDARALQVTGKAAPILENVAGLRNAGAAFFSISESGTLVYGPSRDITSRTDLWRHDVARGMWTKLTTTAPPDFAPVWASDPERVIYASNGRTAAYDIFSIAPDGSAGPELVFESPDNKFPSSWSPTTKRLAYVEYTALTNADIWLLDLSGPAKASVFANTRFSEFGPDFSPDGRWLAYDSDESGRREVFVRPVPPRSGRKMQVSTQGGARPRFSRDGSQLFYISNDRLMATRISFAGDELRPGDTSVRARFPYSGGAVANYAVLPDGRVLRIRREPTEVVVDRLIVVQDWVSQLLGRSDSR